MKERLFGILSVVFLTIPCLLSIPAITQEANTQLSDQGLKIGDRIKDDAGRTLYIIDKDRTWGYVYWITMDRSSILTDPITGLQWRKKPELPGDTKDFYKQDSESSFEETQVWLKANNEGWRIPSYEELETFNKNGFRYRKLVLTSTPSDRNPDHLLLFKLALNPPVSDINEASSESDSNGTSSDDRFSKAKQFLENFDGGGPTVTSRNSALGPSACVFLVRDAKLETPQPNKNLEYAIKIYATPKSVKPDGESTVEITAILYEYTDGKPAERLPGKAINFVLDEFSEFKAGKLSATTAVTDADGQARVIFTAPTGERLQEAPSLKLSSTVNAVCEEYNVEDKAYISYILDDGKVLVEPTPAVISSEGIVPPDKRFPARIRAYFEDENLNSLTNTKVRFWIDAVSPVGMLRGPGGIEGTELELITDEQGFAEVQYYYAAEKQAISPITESIKITSEQMAMPLEAKITVGMNIIFDLVENAYEGKGELNAGEKIPIRVKIKLAEYPNLDLSAFLNYWASNEETGDKLLVKLEIDKISTVPTYLVQRLSLEDPPEPGFSENMTVRSFKDKGELNYLWVPYSSLEGYIGYPKISPQTIGTHYYEAHLTLTDQNGKAIFEADHPARTAFFNIETGMSTDLGQIFFLSNPFRQDTKESQLCGAALGVMGMGTFMSVNDALHMINTGDVDGLFSILFSEVKGWHT